MNCNSKLKLKITLRQYIRVYIIKIMNRWNRFEIQPNRILKNYNRLVFVGDYFVSKIHYNHSGTIHFIFNGNKWKLILRPLTNVFHYKIILTWNLNVYVYTLHNIHIRWPQKKKNRTFWRHIHIKYKIKI